jgi:sigma-E factor negative regulatory protein RseA
MMQEADKSHESISALADGQLRGDAFARTVEWVGESEEAQSTWHTYHLIGDVLRSGESAVSTRDTAFLQRLKLGLQSESSGAAEVGTSKLIAEEPVFVRAGGLKHSVISANEPRFRWRLLAGVALVSLVGWQLVFNGGSQQAVPQLAQVPVSTEVSMVAGAEAAIMIRDPQLDALLVAHRQFGGTSALQMPAGFLRNATFEGAAR